MTSDDTGPPPDLDALLALALDVARDAAALLAERAARPRASVATKSSVTDMVTDADLAAEALIVARIREARPHDGILSEEGAGREGTSGVRWIIDPLDGTTNYLYRFPAYAVSVAVEVHGERVVGVVRDAARGETFSAAAGRGAHLDGRPIEVSGHLALQTALVGTGFAYSPEERATQGRVVAAVLPRVRDIRRAGSAALDLCYVACGRLDGYYERGLREWDLAAGDVIVREAGGRTGAIEGGPARPGSVVAATPRLFEPLRALLQDAER